MKTPAQRAEAWRMMLAYVKTLPSLLSYQALAKAQEKIVRRS